MKSIVTHPTVTSGAKAAVLGLALISLVNCSSSDDTTPQVAPGGSAGLSSPLVFVNNTGDKTLTSVALKGDSGNAVVGTIPAAEFENVALGDMQFSDGDWLFLNLGAANKVATIEDAGEMAVIDDDEASADYRKMINRIDLCNSAKEAAPCNNESATPLTTAFTPNSSLPHGIRWSKLTKKVYSILEGYHNIVEIDPTTLAITKTFDLTGTPYTGYGISADGRFLLLRGDTTPPTGTKLGVIDLGTAATPRTDFTIPELAGTSTGSFKFSPDGKRFYILAGNAAASTKKDRLFAFDALTLTATTPALTLIKEIQLIPGGDSAGFSAAHSLDVLAQGAGEAKYIVVSNKADNSLSIINATDNLIKQTVTNVGPLPGGVIVYAPGTAAAGNQATASITGGSQASASALPDQLDDHGMLK